MKRNSRVVFHWTNKNGTKDKLETIGRNFKNYAIELMEDELLDRVFNVHYTVDDEITKRLDYYNTEELS